MMRIFLIVSTLILSSCNPFFGFRPPSFTKKSLAKINHVKNGQEIGIHIAVDNFGIPFIKADNIPNLMYGLGFMHARDRLFQIDVMRHAALGRVAELFGEQGLVFDRKFENFNL